MRNKFSHFALAAIFGLALAFTFSCSSGGGDDPGGGQGGSFNPNSQIYNAYWDDDDNQHIGEAYKGSGVITFDSENVGSVTNGIVANFKLPTSIPNELDDFMDDEFQSYCTSYPKGIKYARGGRFYLTDNNGNGGSLGLYIEYDNGKFGEGIYYWYFSKAGKIACNYYREDKDEKEGITYKDTKIFDIDAKEGWNTIYLHEEWTNGTNTRTQVEKWSTTNVLTRKMKWTINK